MQENFGLIFHTLLVFECFVLFDFDGAPAKEKRTFTKAASIPARIRVKMKAQCFLNSFFFDAADRTEGWDKVQGSADPSFLAGLPLSRCPKSWNFKHFAVQNILHKTFPGIFPEVNLPPTANIFPLFRAQHKAALAKAAFDTLQIGFGLLQHRKKFLHRCTFRPS